MLADACKTLTKENLQNGWKKLWPIEEDQL